MFVGWLYPGLCICRVGWVQACVFVGLAVKDTDVTSLKEFHTMHSSANFQTPPILYYSYVRMIRFITNKKHAFMCIY